MVSRSGRRSIDATYPSPCSPEISHPVVLQEAGEKQPPAPPPISGLASGIDQRWSLNLRGCARARCSGLIAQRSGLPARRSAGVAWLRGLGVGALCSAGAAGRGPRPWTFSMRRCPSLSPPHGPTPPEPCIGPIQTTKKPPLRVASSFGRFYLASSYFRRGLPPNYRRRCCVSRPSSRWIGVGPQRHGHQDRHALLHHGHAVIQSTPTSQVNPENCIGLDPHSPSWLSPSSQSFNRNQCSWIFIWKVSVELALSRSSDGQALGLLVLLRFTHYCAST